MAVCGGTYIGVVVGMTGERKPDVLQGVSFAKGPAYVNVHTTPMELGPGDSFEIYVDHDSTIDLSCDGKPLK